MNIIVYNEALAEALQLKIKQLEEQTAKLQQTDTSLEISAQIIAVQREIEDSKAELVNCASFLKNLHDTPHTLVTQFSTNISNKLITYEAQQDKLPPVDIRVCLYKLPEKLNFITQAAETNELPASLLRIQYLKLCGLVQHMYLQVKDKEIEFNFFKLLTDLLEESHVALYGDLPDKMRIGQIPTDYIKDLKEGDKYDWFPTPEHLPSYEKREPKVNNLARTAELLDAGKEKAIYTPNKVRLAQDSGLEEKELETSSAMNKDHLFDKAATKTATHSNSKLSKASTIVPIAPVKNSLPEKVIGITCVTDASVQLVSSIKPLDKPIKACTAARESDSLKRRRSLTNSQNKSTLTAEQEYTRRLYQLRTQQEYTKRLYQLPTQAASNNTLHIKIRAAVEAVATEVQAKKVRQERIDYPLYIELLNCLQKLSINVYDVDLIASFNYSAEQVKPSYSSPQLIGAIAAIVGILLIAASIATLVATFGGSSLVSSIGIVLGTSLLNSQIVLSVTAGITALTGVSLTFWGVSTYKKEQQQSLLCVLNELAEELASPPTPTLNLA